ANWRLISECVREVLDRQGVDPSAVAALSTTSMREGMVLYDSSGQEVWACPNVDSRAGAEAADLVQRGLAERIYRQGGDWVAITAPAARGPRPRPGSAGARPSSWEAPTPSAAWSASEWSGRGRSRSSGAPSGSTRSGFPKP